VAVVQLNFILRVFRHQQKHVTW